MSDSSSNVCMLSLWRAQSSCWLMVMDVSAKIHTQNKHLRDPVEFCQSTLAEFICIAERLRAYLCTQAHALFSLYSGLDCSADTIARRDEKFLRIRHSCWETIKRKTVINWPHFCGMSIDESVCFCQPERCLSSAG